MARLKSDMVDSVISEIMKKIDNYIYVSGDVISEVSLAEELNVSRTPVREAIFNLLGEGVLERTATKTVVKTVTIDDIRDTLELREAVELMAVRCIIKKGGLTDAEKAELIKINDELSESISNGNFESNFEQDSNFHEYIVSVSGNAQLVTVCKRISLQSKRLRWISTLTPTRYSDTKDEHLVIVEALLEKDLEASQNAISKHLENAVKNYEFVLSDDKWLRLSSELKRMQVN